MQVLLILYKSALSVERVTELFRERATKYGRVPGLLQKLYIHDPETDEVGGIYLFDTRAHVDGFLGSDLEKSIQDTYRFVAPPLVRSFDVVQALHEDKLTAIGTRKPG